MNDPVGVALIGTGMWGRRLAAAVRHTPALHLICGYSRDEGRRNAFAQEVGCESAASFEAAVDRTDVEGFSSSHPTSCTPNRRPPAPPAANTSS